MLVCAFTIICTFLVQCSAIESFITPNDLSVNHIELSGTIRTQTSRDPILLHVFVTSSQRGTYTDITGYLFAEAVSRYAFTPWGHSNQPPSVKEWGFPITFRDCTTGKVAHANVSTELWDRHQASDLHYPVPFTATFVTTVVCMEVIVNDWLHTAEVCLKQGPTPLDKLLQKQQDKAVSVWSILTPYRGYNQIPAFISAVIHYSHYHTKVGFSGTVLYASPYLMRELLKDIDIISLVQEGRLLLLLWDRFNQYQQVVGNQTYYQVPDQLIIINHALLAFSAHKHAALFMGDIDEFFVPMPPIRTVHDFLECPTCWEGVDENERRPWGAININRMNFCSNVELQSTSKNSESMLWKLAARALDCSPLQTYRMASAQKPPGVKVLLRPAGGVHAWHVHTGVLNRSHGLYKTSDGCAFVLHAVNMWSERVKRESFTLRRGKWRSLLLQNCTVQEYVGRCLPPTVQLVSQHNVSYAT